MTTYYVNRDSPIPFWGMPAAERKPHAAASTPAVPPSAPASQLPSPEPIHVNSSHLVHAVPYPDTQWSSALVAPMDSPGDPDCTVPAAISQPVPGQDSPPQVESPVQQESWRTASDVVSPDARAPPSVATAPAPDATASNCSALLFADTPAACKTTVPGQLFEHAAAQPQPYGIQPPDVSVAAQLSSQPPYLRPLSEHVTQSTHAELQLLLAGRAQDAAELQQLRLSLAARERDMAVLRQQLMQQAHEADEARISASASQQQQQNQQQQLQQQQLAAVEHSQELAELRRLHADGVREAAEREASDAHKLTQLHQLLAAQAQELTDLHQARSAETQMHTDRQAADALALVELQQALTAQSQELVDLRHSHASEAVSSEQQQQQLQQAAFLQQLAALQQAHMDELTEVQRASAQAAHAHAELQQALSHELATAQHAVDALSREVSELRTLRADGARSLADLQQLQHAHTQQSHELQQLQATHGAVSQELAEQRQSRAGAALGLTCELQQLQHAHVEQGRSLAETQHALAAALGELAQQRQVSAASEAGLATDLQQLQHAHAELRRELAETQQALESASRELQSGLRSALSDSAVGLASSSDEPPPSLAADVAHELRRARTEAARQLTDLQQALVQKDRELTELQSIRAAHAGDLREHEQQAPGRSADANGDQHEVAALQSKLAEASRQLTEQQAEMSRRLTEQQAVQQAHAADVTELEQFRQSEATRRQELEAAQQLRQDLAADLRELEVLRQADADRAQREVAALQHALEEKARGLSELQALRQAHATDLRELAELRTARAEGARALATQTALVQQLQRAAAAQFATAAAERAGQEPCSVPTAPVTRGRSSVDLDDEPQKSVLRLHKAERALEQERGVVSALQRQVEELRTVAEGGARAVALMDQVRQELDAERSRAADREAALAAAQTTCMQQQGAAAQLQEQLAHALTQRSVADDARQAEQLDAQASEIARLSADVANLKAAGDAVRMAVRSAEDRAAAANAVSLDMQRQCEAAGSTIGRLIDENNELTEKVNSQAAALAAALRQQTLSSPAEQSHRSTPPVHHPRNQQQTPTSSHRQPPHSSLQPAILAQQPSAATTASTAAAGAAAAPPSSTQPPTQRDLDLPGGLTDGEWKLVMLSEEVLELEQQVAAERECVKQLEAQAAARTNGGGPGSSDVSGAGSTLNGEASHEARHEAHDTAGVHHRHSDGGGQPPHAEQQEWMTSRTTISTNGTGRAASEGGGLGWSSGAVGGGSSSVSGHESSTQAAGGTAGLHGSSQPAVVEVAAGPSCGGLRASPGGTAPSAEHGGPLPAAQQQQQQQQCFDVQAFIARLQAGPPLADEQVEGRVVQLAGHMQVLSDELDALRGLRAHLEASLGDRLCESVTHHRPAAVGSSASGTGQVHTSVNGVGGGNDGVRRPADVHVAVAGSGGAAAERARGRGTMVVDDGDELYLDESPVAAGRRCLVM